VRLLAALRRGAASTPHTLSCSDLCLRSGAPASCEQGKGVVSPASLPLPALRSIQFVIVDNTPLSLTLKQKKSVSHRSSCCAVKAKSWNSKFLKVNQKKRLDFFTGLELLK